MKAIALLCLLVIFSLQLQGQSLKTRLIVLADMGSEPDEEQQIVHLMMYANEFDLEGLIAVTGKYLNPESRNPFKQVLHPELFLKIISGYEKVLPNLKKHASYWPESRYLRSIVASGQPAYGMAGTGLGKSSPGSDHLIDRFLDPDPRPIYIVVNAGSNTLAQALIDFEAQYGSELLDKTMNKLRVFENGAQDDAGAWICANYPTIHWVRSNFQTYCYGGPGWDSAKGEADRHVNLGPYTWQPYAYSSIGQHQWALEHIKGDHGLLGKLWPIRQMGSGTIGYLEGGGTIPWMGLIHHGLSTIDKPHWGGWSCRFTRGKIAYVWSKHKSVRMDEENYGEFSLYTEAKDQWHDPETDSSYHDIYAPVWRWRRAMYNDFKCRMDWCIKPYEEANHNPIVIIDGDSIEQIMIRKVKAATTVTLDASASFDPDGDDIGFKWWIYKEAGTFDGTIAIEDDATALCQLQIPKTAGGTDIHVILEIKDKNHIASMYDYRRVVLHVVK